MQAFWKQLTLYQFRWFCHETLATIYLFGLLRFTQNVLTREEPPWTRKGSVGMFLWWEKSCWEKLRMPSISENTWTSYHTWGFSSLWGVGNIGWLVMCSWCQSAIYAWFVRWICSWLKGGSLGWKGGGNALNWKSKCFLASRFQNFLLSWFQRFQNTFNGVQDNWSMLSNAHFMFKW